MEVKVTARGDVPEEAQELARDEVARLERYVKGPVMGAQVVLTQEENPRIRYPMRAEGAVTIPGRTVRARAAGMSMSAAVDDLAERLQDQLVRFMDRISTTQREPAEAPPGQWRHASRPTVRPERSFRSPEERRIERRKVYGVSPMTVEEAALEMDALDHEFFLFHDSETDADAVLHRDPEGRFAVVDAPGTVPPDRPGPPRRPARIPRPIDLRSAVREMNELNERFLFFVNEETRRGNVLYLRYDGHYGLIEPAERA